MDAPVFSWTVEDAAGEPAWASLTVNVGGETVYQSGEIPEADSLGWRIDLPLKPRTRYDYTLTVRSTGGDQASADAFLRPAAPGYHSAILEPKPDRRLVHVRAELETETGRFVSAWRCKGDSVYYDFTVPFGASAELHLPGKEPKELGAGRYQYEGAQDVLSD